MIFYQRNIIVLILCIAVGIFPASADSTVTQQDAETELTGIQKMIRLLSSRLSSARSKKNTVQEQLQKAELAIGELVTELRKIEGRRQRQQKQLKNLRRQREEQNKALLAQRQDLARQIRTSYAMGRQDYLKILLNHEDPSALARTLTYYGYFNQARAARIEAIRSQIERIHTLKGEIDRETTVLEGLKRAKIKAKSSMEEHSRKRKDALAKLSLEIARDDQRLAYFQQDKNRLEKLINKLKQAFTHFPNQQPFYKRRGHLHWPTAGPIRHDFGTKRSLGNLTWQGVLIAAKAGQPIHAISHGRVIFADWLRGFGLLLIIDHGNGYMSLYGHNQSLYKEAGDLIQPGEVIASVGNSGGNTENGLYFEIRHQGFPQNPAYWCRKPALAASKS